MVTTFLRISESLSSREMEAQVSENFLNDDQYKFFNKHSTKTDYGVIRLGKFFFFTSSVLMVFVYSIPKS